ncbi:hypothetical protein [Acidithiobacillus sp. AMEEHan]|uniref:hypothetical protein n=1 Tax=Acidithiobacillus sp. AMEEHan TaxID=2994951 RepID=UPI0027E3B501|nr:hypothetical protein [Acidithiobacillus sp. AMEEHan]
MPPISELPINRFCGAEAVTLWECRLPKKTVVLCLQRQGTGLKRLSVREVTPQTKIRELVHGGQPGVYMDYENTPNGDASLKITTPAVIYTLIDPLHDQSILEVSQKHGSKRRTCQNPNQTLMLNYTIAFFRKFGLKKNDSHRSDVNSDATDHADITNSLQALELADKELRQVKDHAELEVKMLSKTWTVAQNQAVWRLYGAAQRFFFRLFRIRVHHQRRGPMEYLLANRSRKKSLHRVSSSFAIGC